MKRSYIYIIILLAIAGGSCKKDLQEYNPSGITDATVFTTPAGFETVVNAAYSYTRWWYGKEYGFNISEMGTDIWTSGASDSWPDLTNYLNLQSNQEALGAEWTNFYAAVNLCNAGINRIGQSGLSDALQKTRRAELKYLRAFYNWHIVETWGDVHLSTEETVGIITTANKTPAEKFYELIFADLTEAVQNLPVTTTDFGRATKPAAQAFLARMYLTRGMNKEAADLAKKVITDYSFQLEPKFADLWKMSNLNSKEVIWSVNYSTNLLLNDLRDGTLYPGGHNRGSNNAHLFFLMRYDQQPGMVRDVTNGRPFNSYMPTLFLLNLFNETIDARYDGSFRMAWFANQTDASKRPAGMALGDTAILCSKYEIPDAFEATRKYRVFDRSKNYNPDGSSKEKVYCISLKKFDDPTRDNVTQIQSARDVFVIRLAEMYLIAAEGEMKQGHLQIAADYVNTLRTRAAQPGRIADMQVAPADITLDFILDERAREFAGEQIRWFDLKRTGRLLDRVKLYNLDAGRNIQSYHLVRPIPQTQIDAVTNKTEFKQNPGYQ